jgi:holo-[acyl-carrier protein] synthase
MILGIGTDLVDVRRVEQLILKHGQRFLEKTFTETEILASKKYSEGHLRTLFFAKRFAAKEAFSKAVGCGFGEHLKFLDLSIENNLKGKPSLVVKGESLKYLSEYFTGREIKIDLSLSDEYPMALAFIVVSADFR